MWGLARGGYRTLEDPMFGCDLVFTADGDNAARWKDAGVTHVWLPPGVLKDECYIAEPDPESYEGVDVAFVGSKGYHPEWPHRHQLIDFLHTRYGDRFLHVGPDGSQDTTRGHALNVLYATVPVVVGDSCFANVSEKYWSDRLPETWGRGGFMIFPRIDGAVRDVPGHPTWKTYDWDRLGSVINAWLKTPKDRDMVRRQLHKHVLENCTYHNRLSALLATVGAYGTGAI